MRNFLILCIGSQLAFGSLVVVAQQAPNAVPGALPVGPVDDRVLWLYGLSLVGTIAGYIYNIYRENQKRRHDMEDREAAREEMRAKLDQTVAKVDENTAITKGTQDIAVSNEAQIAEIARLFTQEAGDQASERGAASADRRSRS